MNKLIFILSIILALSFNYSKAQSTICTDTVFSGNTPFDACIICDLSLLDGYTGTTSGFFPGFDSPFFCGTIENSQFFPFYAPQEYVVFLVETYNCQGTPTGFGVQGEVYSSDCISDGPFTLQPVSNCASVGTDIPFELVASNLTVGEVYYLFIDGWAGDICDFTISVIEPIGGVAAPFDLTPPTGIIGDDVQCILGGVGTTSLYSVECPQEYENYQWTVEQNGTIVQTVAGTNIEIDFLAIGTTIICVSKSNECGSSSEICQEVFVGEGTVEQIDTTVCAGQIIVIGGEPILSSGNHTINLVNSMGCDSIIEVSLENIIIDTVEVFAEICDGESYEIGDEIYTEEGFYLPILESYQGCDSLVLLDLVVNGETTFIQETICEGETFPFNGNILNMMGTYQDTLPTSSGCDSIITLNLMVDTPSTVGDTIFVEICGNDFFQFGNEVHNETGIYSQMIPTEGCDSTAYLNLTVSPSVVLINVDIINDTGSGTGSITVELGGGVGLLDLIWSDGTIGPTLTDVLWGNYSLTATDSLGCAYTFPFSILLIDGIINEDDSNEFRLFPNPMSNQSFLNLDYSQPGKNLNLTLFDARGQLLWEKNYLTTENLIQLKMPDVSGVYLLKIKIKELEFVEKIVVW